MIKNNNPSSFKCWSQILVLWASFLAKRLYSYNMVLVEIFSEGLSFQREVGFAQEPRMPVESETSLFFYQRVQQKWMWKNVWSWWWLESCGTLHPKLYSKGILSKKTVDGSLNHFDPPWIIRLIHQTTKTSGCTMYPKNGRTKAMKDLQKKFRGECYKLMH